MMHQRMQRRPVYVHPKPQVRRVVPHPGPGAPGAPVLVDKPVVIPDKPPAEATFVVDVLGDSLGQLLAQGLQEAYADRPEITVVRKAKGDTGLVTEDFYDWPKAVRELLASNEKVSMAVIMIGSNDRQQVRDANGRYEPLSTKWKEIYGNRVEEIARAFKDKKIPLVWVGLPISKSDRMSSDYSEINEIYRERAAKHDATFVDIWEAFGDSRGLYNAFGPDVNGVTVKLRALDGVHFTKPGARKLAHFVEAEVKRLFDLLKPRTEPGVATLEGLPAPLAPAEQPAAPAPQGAAAPPASPTPAGQQAALPPPGPPPPPPKPTSGPIMPLTTPPIAPGGDLARRSRTRDTSNDAQALLDRALGRGQPLDPKPNRADDFTWPRAEPQ
jgi:lysophospholipase L1-like esterase